jgi:hypothetical protein
MNADRSKKNSRKITSKLLALLALALASIGATGCEHPLSTMFNQQGETARTAMEQQTALMQEILADQREREDALLERIDELENDEGEYDEDDEECIEETGEPCPDEDEDEDDDEGDDEEDTELALGDADEDDAGGLDVTQDSVD